MDKKTEDKIRSGLEEVYDGGVSEGKIRSYERILGLIEKGVINNIEAVKIACTIGIENERFDTTGE
jgi:hypothetical protein